MPPSSLPAQGIVRPGVAERLAPNSDPILVGLPVQRGYGQWRVSRMRDVRAVLGDASTTVDLLTPKAIARLREQHGTEAEAAMAILRVVARAHRTPNDAERLDAIAVTKRLQAALPAQDLHAPFRTLAAAGGASACAMAAILRPILMPWRAAALGVDAGLGQRIEEGLLHLIVTLEQAGIARLAALEPLAQEIIRDMAALGAARREATGMPVMHLISPAFLAIVPIGYTGVSMLAHLAENPDLQEELRTRPGLRPDYLREVERLLNAFRYATRQIGPAGLDLGDAHLPPRSLAVLDLVAANRDPAIWDAPDLCRLDRPRQPTASFGFGPLACTGGQLSRQFLARLLDTALETVRLSVPTPGDGPDRRPAAWSIARGYDLCRLHVSAL